MGSQLCYITTSSSHRWVTLRLIPLLLLLIVCLFARRHMKRVYVCVSVREGCLRLKSFDNCGGMVCQLLHFLPFPFYYSFVKTNVVSIYCCTLGAIYMLFLALCNKTECDENKRTYRA